MNFQTLVAKALLSQTTLTPLRIDLGNISLTDTVLRGIYVFDDASTTRISSDGGLGIVRTTAAGAAIEVNDDGLGPITASPVFTYFGTIDNTAASSYLLSSHRIQ